jgi:two-component system, NarL family, nitrate/nitrite response regulator NarL
MSSEKRKPIRILIVDEYKVFREGICLLLESQGKMQVVGEAGDCGKAISLAGREQPDVILIGLEMTQGQDPIDCFPELHAAAPKTRILVLTGAWDPMIQSRAVRRGAAGLVHKTQDGATVIKAIEKVHEGEAWLDHKLTASVLSEVLNAPPKDDPNPYETRLSTLTKREREITIFLRDGLKSREIAEKLYISTNTVRNHMASIYSKRGVTDRFDLYLFLARTQLAKSPTY